MRGISQSPDTVAPHLPASGVNLEGRANVSTARSGDGTVFLDLAMDDYYCRYDPAATTGNYRYLTEGEHQTGLDVSRPVLQSRWHDAHATDFLPAGIRDLANFIISLIISSIRFRRKSVAELGNITRSLGYRKYHGSITPDQAANIFQYYLLFMPFNPECLFRSFALLHFLDRYGLRADWVFGVQLFPFRAHCWVATGDMLLNDLKEGVEDYEPIWTIAGGSE